MSGVVDFKKDTIQMPLFSQ